MKYLVLLAVIAVAYAWWRAQHRLPPAPPAPPAPRGSGAPEPMVRCAHCGVHLPRSQALQHDGRSYCCPAHQRQG